MSEKKEIPLCGATLIFNRLYKNPIKSVDVRCSKKIYVLTWFLRVEIQDTATTAHSFILWFEIKSRNHTFLASQTFCLPIKTKTNRKMVEQVTQSTGQEISDHYVECRQYL